MQRPAFAALALCVVLTLVAALTTTTWADSSAPLDATPRGGGGNLPDPADDYEPPLPEVTSAAASDAPNVLLITTDDQSLEDMRWMPKTRRLLGERGMTFSQMLSPHPLCCPARAEILTGQFAQNNGVHTNGGRYGGYKALKSPQNTLPRWLYAGGFHTAVVGKFINHWKPNRDGVPLGWEYFDVSRTSGFGYYDFKMFTQGKKRRYNNGKAYSTTYTTNRTVALVRNWAEQGAAEASDQEDDKPFFIWSSYYAPHGLCGEGDCKKPPTPERRHARAYKDAKSPSLTKKSFSAALDEPNGVIAGSPVADRGQVQSMFRERIRSLKSVDDGVERIVQALEDAGELENTIILFTSDNGYLLGEHRYQGKVLAYEEALRVPLLARGPGIPQGATSDEMITMVDLAPTILGVTGVAATGRTLDGRDMTAVLRGTGTKNDDTLLIQAGGFPNGEAREWLYRGVRTSRYTFTNWHRDRGHFYELFDRRVDPDQVQNLATDRRYARVVQELRRRTSELNRCSGAGECFRQFGKVPAPAR